jgi:hypothetical protein
MKKNDRVRALAKLLPTDQLAHVNGGGSGVGGETKPYDTAAVPRGPQS